MFYCLKVLISAIFEKRLTDGPTDGQNLLLRCIDASNKPFDNVNTPPTKILLLDIGFDREIAGIWLRVNSNDQVSLKLNRPTLADTHTGVLD